MKNEYIETLGADQKPALENESLFPREQHEKCEFFLDPSELGYLLERVDQFNQCLLNYQVPKELLEQAVENVNNTLQQSGIEKTVPPETVFDRRILWLLYIGFIAISVFIIFGMIEIYFHSSQVLFTIGLASLGVGLLALFLIIVLNGDCRLKRRSVLALSAEQTRAIHNALGEVIAKENRTLAAYQLMIKLNVEGTKLRLMSTSLNI